MLYAVWYVVTCMLHGHSTSLENAWLTAFGDFGTDKRSVSQFIYQCWYIQDRLSSDIFKVQWNKITGEELVDVILCRPILSRWGYPLETASRIDENYDLWMNFLATL